MSRSRKMRGASFTFALLAIGAAVATPAAWAAPGDLDPTFGAAGKVVTDFGADDRSGALLVLPGGKYLAGGRGGEGASFALAQYNVDGTLDTTFGTGGKVTVDFGLEEEIRGLALQEDGKIVAAGSSKVNDLQQSFFALARFHPDGSLDTSFGNAGKVLTSFGPGGVLGASARGVAMRSDGKIVAAGVAGIDFALARYNPDGSPDPTFGTDGQVMTDATGLTDHGFTMTQLPNEKIMVAGVADRDFGAARYNENGSLDPTFGNNGIVRTDFEGASGDTDNAYAIALRPDGRFLLGGAANSPEAFGFFSDGFALAGYTSSGALDTTFGTGGRVLTPFSTLIDGIRGLTHQADGKLVAVGGVNGAFSSGNGAATGDTSDFGLARYTASGALDPTFGSGGLLATDFAGGADRALAVRYLPNGKILIAGVAGGNFALARYDA